VYGHHTFVVGATRAAIKIAVGFHTVTDNFAAAVFALGRQGVNGAFKAVEKMRCAILDDFQRLIVIVTANFTFHMSLRYSLSRRASLRVA
jgi:hypothetical protein